MIRINSQNQYCQYHRLEGLKDYTDFVFYTIKNLCNSCNQRKSVIQTNKRINKNLSNIDVNG